MSTEGKISRVLLGGAATLVLAGALTIGGSRDARATPKLAKQTGMACAGCHQDPKGGAKLNPFGVQFKADGNKLPAKPADPSAPAP
jgi:hypothetical protein